MMPRPEPDDACGSAGKTPYALRGQGALFGVCAMAALSRTLNQGADPRLLDADLDATLATAVRGLGVDGWPGWSREDT